MNNDTNTQTCYTADAGNGCACGTPFSVARANTAENGELAEAGKYSHYKYALYSLGALLFIAGIILPLQGLTELVVFGGAYLLWGGGVLLRAGRNIVRGVVFDENFLMSIATIGAFAIGEYPEGVAVMVFYQVGEMLQDRAVNRSRRSIRSLMDIRPDYARIIEGEATRTINPELVNPGDIIVVHPGERIPLDGKVVQGSSALDVSALTGEPLPRDVSTGDEVLSGSVNKSALLNIKVSKKYSDSTVSRILNLVENAAGRKAKTEKFITRFARYYTPAVVGAAALLAVLPPLLLAGQDFSTWTYRALVFLVISCPCALVISIPLGFIGGIGGASRKGILVKGGNFLEALSRIHTVVFDKTGTLTRGSFKVSGIYPSGSFSEEDLLSYGATAAVHTSHPVAVPILRAGNHAKRNIIIESYDEIPGRGVRVKSSKEEIIMGNGNFMADNGIMIEKSHDDNSRGTEVHLAVNNEYAGNILVIDEIREDSSEAVKLLKKLGVRNIIMLTGDKKSAAEKTGRETGMDLVFSELLPHQKVEMVEKIKQDAGKENRVAFVGDGINDAPALARADIGVAMGGIGSDAALEAADVVLMTGEPSKLADAITVARKTRSIVIQNVALALGIKAVIMLLGAMGLASMWEAVFADVGVTLLAVLNAMRAINS